MEDAEKLSLLGLECIIGYLDANKRIQLSLCFNQFRSFEKRVPLRLEKSILYSSNIEINEFDCTFKEFDLPIEQVEEPMQEVKGREWSSLFDDVPEPGDVTFKRYDGELVLEQQKEVKLQEFRNIFMGLLEKFLTSEEGINPMDIFERHITKDRIRWQIQFPKIFEDINGSPSRDVRSVYCEHPLADYDVAVEDELTELYPKAFKVMKSRIEELTVLGDVRSTALKRLAYAPVIVPYFNQFTIWREKRPLYQNRLPEGLSIRRALKQFSTVILGGRKHIQCRNFAFRCFGIIPLPVWLKFDFGEIPFNIVTKTGLFMRFYFGNVNEQKEFAISMLLRQGEGVNPIMATKCYYNTHSESPRKETIQVGIIGPSVEYCFTIIEEWCKQKHQTIGSKLMIVTCSDPSRIPHISPDMLNSNRFLEMGFRRNQRNQSLFLQKSETTRVELTVQQDMKLLSCNFDGMCALDFLHLEIIGSD